MPFKNFVKAIPVSELLAADFDATFQVFRESGLNEACFLIRIINDSNQDIFISYDGITVHDVLKSNETLQLEFQTNSSPNNFQALMKKGQKIYVRGAVAGLGSVYLVGYYQPQGA